MFAKFYQKSSGINSVRKGKRCILFFVIEINTLHPTVVILSVLEIKASR